MKHPDRKLFLISNMRKPLISALLLAGIASVPNAEAALRNGYTLGITGGTNSWFGMQLNDGYETQTMLFPGDAFAASGRPTRDGGYPGCGAGCYVGGGYPGIVLGTIQAVPNGPNRVYFPDGSHGGQPYASDIGGIDAPWYFASNTGMDFTTSPANVLSATGNTATVDLSGWTVTWNTIPSISMGSRAWNGTTQLATYSGMTDGAAQITCAAGCLHGDTYTLSYTATVPNNDSSGFGNVKYSLHMAGSISAPLPVISGPANITATQSTLKSWTPVVDDPNAICSITTAASYGTATVASDCSSGTYNPTSGYTGSDSFAFKADNSVSGTANSTTATVSVTVSATPPPTANADTATVNGTTAASIDVLTNDTDGSYAISASTVAISTPASHGTATANPSGAVTYTASSGFTGSDTFQYTVNDTNGQTSNAATVTVTVRATAPSSSSGTFGPGTTATNAGSTTGGGLTTSDVGTDSELIQQCVGGCFDFSVTGLSSGGTVNVVLPLSTGIPAGAVYRKLIGSTWLSFATGNGNAIASAAAISTGPLVCPAAGSSSYSSGLTAGNRCVQLTIVDGRTNDSDGATNGTVLDPGGIGVVASAAPQTFSGSTGGCSLVSRPSNFTERGDWAMVTMFVAWLGGMVYRRRRRRTA